MIFIKFSKKYFFNRFELFDWLKINSKFDALQEKIKYLLIEAINDFENQDVVDNYITKHGDALNTLTSLKKIKRR